MAGGDQAGSAYVPIRPDMRGFHTEIERELRRTLGPIIGRIAQQMGREFGSGFGRGTEDGDPFEPFEQEQQQQRRRQRREGQEQGGAFAASFARALSRASDQLPRLEIDADSSEADRTLAELRGRMERLAASRVGVDVSAEDAQQELDEIREALAEVQDGADVQVRMDVGAALGQLNRFREQIDRLDADDVEVDVDVDVDEAEGGMLRLSRASDALGSTLRGLGAAGRVGLGTVGAGLRGLNAGTRRGARGVLGLGAASVGVFGAMSGGVAGVAAGIAGLGVALALQNEGIRQVFTDTFGAIQKQAVSLAKPFIGPLREVAKIIKGTFGEIAPELGRAFKAIAPALVPVAQGIGQMVESLSALFVPMAEIGASILRSLGPALATLGQQLVQFLTPVLEALQQVGAGAFAGLITGVGQLLVSLGPLLGVLVEVGATLLGPLLQALNVVVGALVQALIPVIRAIAPVFTQLVQALAPLTAQLVTGLSPILVALAPILSEIFRVLQPVISSLISALLPVISSLVPVVGLLVSAFGQIITALVPLLQPLGQLIASLVSGLLPVLTPIIGLIAQTASTIIGALVQALIQCMPALQSIVMAIAQLLPLLTPLIPLWGQLVMQLIPLIPLIVNLVAMLVGYLVPVLRLIITVVVKIVSTVIGWLIPVFQRIVQVITWVVGLVQPLLTLIGRAFQWLGQAALWLWNNAIKPAFTFIATLGKWLYQIIAVVVIGALLIAFKVLSTAVKWLYNAIFKPIFQAIGAVIGWVWRTLIQPVLNAFRSVIRNVIAPVVRWIYNSVIKPVWNAVGSAIRWVWENVIKKVFDAVKSQVQRLAGYFRTAVSAIGKAWDKLKSAARKPVKYVVDVVYNKGIVRIWNAVADLVPGVGSLDPIKFARGGLVPAGGYGVLPGYAPGRDTMLAAVSPGEAWIRPDATRALGSDFVYGLNNAAVSGGTAGAARFLAEAGAPRFGLGGIVGGFLKSAKGFFSDGLVNTATKAFDPLLDLARRAIGGTAFGDLAVGAARGLVGKILSFFKPLEDKIGGDGRRVVKVAEKYVGVSGNPNQWTRRMGMDGLPWCGMFVDGVFDEANASRALNGVANPASVWSYRALPSVSPNSKRPGDLALYRGDAGHINIYTGKGAITIGGNESNSVRRQSGYIHSASSIRRPRFALGGIVPDILAQDRRNNSKQTTPLATQMLRTIAGQPTHDDGGWLPPGLNLVANYTRRPEAVLTDRQYAALASAARVGTAGGTTYVVYPREHTLTEAGLARMTQRQDALARIGRPT